ncbi:MAG: glycosyltransferase family 2 protein [Lachnospiraceae bacterium]|nr:glycosyltransferase family 2 protein [Lachnospiraceae bacterium]
MPKVSICIPTYNNIAQIKRCMESILQQKFKDYEVIITDDSDNDDIEIYIDQVNLNMEVEKRPLVRYYHNEEKLGPVYNWNKALELAEGEYCKIMFSDDWFSNPDSLQEFVNMLEEHPGAGMAFSGSSQITVISDQREWAVSRLDQSSAWDRAASAEFVDGLRKDYRHLFLGNEIGTPSATIFRRCDVLFDPRSNWASDMFLYFDLFVKNPNFVSTEKPLVSVGMHHDQYTYTFKDHDERKFGDYLYMYQKYNLKDSPECMEYLKNDFLLPYYKPVSLAEECGISGKTYRTELLHYIWQHKVMDYLHAAGKKIRR